MFATNRAGFGSLRKTVVGQFKNIRKYLSRKNPKSLSYPYVTHNAHVVLDDAAVGYDFFDLVGDNWVDSPDKPVLLVLGCNEWKLGFVADYFPDYRVCFARRKAASFYFINLRVRNLKPLPANVVVWGDTVTGLSKYSLRKIFGEIWVLEDGFIRSSDLGAAHTVPYSLVVDKKGIYYSSQSPSDVEDLLNSYECSSAHQLLDQSRALINAMLGMKISKYNPPAIFKDKSIKIRKRVAVLGQVDKDASIRYGNPDKWTSESLVMLAHYENPGAEILYRPHPEVYKGFQRSSFKEKNITAIADIVSPDENVIEFLESVDHVYTITSLSGLDALIRGKKVTVVGAPFYSGWGLTDDRVNISRRMRKRSLEELVAIVYLVYPKYLANLDCQFIGAMSAIYKIQADKKIVLQSSVKKMIEGGLINKDFDLNSETLPSVLLNISDLSEKDASQLLGRMNFNAVLNSRAGALYVGFVARYLIGQFGRFPGLQSTVLAKVREIIDGQDLNQILIDLTGVFSQDVIKEQWVWLANKQGDIAEWVHIEKYVEDKYIYEGASEEQGEDLIPACSLEKIGFLENVELALATGLILRGSHEQAIQRVNRIFLLGQDKRAVFSRALEIAKNSFDFCSYRSLAVLMQSFGLERNGKRYVSDEFKSLRYLGQHIDAASYFLTLVKTVSYLPQTIEAVFLNLELRSEIFDKNTASRIFEGMLDLTNDFSVEKALAYIGLGKFKKAASLMRNSFSAKNGSVNHAVHYARALSYFDLDTARRIIEELVAKNPGVLSVGEALRIYIVFGYYDRALNLIRASESAGVRISEMNLRKCYFGNRMIFDAFQTFTKIKPALTLSEFYRDKYLRTCGLVSENGKVLLLAIFGPGDEIRFASIYGRLASLISADKITITCTPRLQSIFERSFPLLDFVPSIRIRGTDPIDLDNYTSVPDSRLIEFVDNNAVQAIGQTDKLCLVTDLLHVALPDYDAFEGKAYLTADLALVEKFKPRLPVDKKIIGISWRSSLTTVGRNEHYLSIDDLAPLFALDNVYFFNMQYDECREEVEWVQRNYPGRLIHFDDVDQYNDFESVAALMKCMDLIIAPATTVVELAGALGCKTWLFSNSSEIDWRKIDSDGTDVWHRSVKIVDVEEKGNKSALVNELVRRVSGI